MNIAKAGIKYFISLLQLSIPGYNND